MPSWYLTCTRKALELVLWFQLRTLERGRAALGSVEAGGAGEAAASLPPHTAAIRGRAEPSAKMIPSERIKTESGPLLAVIKKHCTFNRSLFN